MEHNARFINSIEAKRDIYTAMSDRIWELAETRFEERQSAALLCDHLEREGFFVERGIAGIETAFAATFGSGAPVIGILGEYDALSGMSQKPGLARQEPLIPNANGHGCGHHMLGVGAMAAAIALKEHLSESGLSGTIRFLGCPAEEGGSGKTFMAREHVFDGLDAALTWHPQAINSTMCCSMLANIQVLFQFYGVSAHAALAPHLGRSALDAVELMNVGVNYMREHIIPEARVHYAVTNTGGASPNIVQARADVLYLIRAPKLTDVRDIYARIVDVAKGAALMTGTRVEVRFDKAASNVVINETLSRLLQEKMTELGAPAAPPEESELAKALWETLNKAERDAAFRFISPSVAQQHQEPFAQWINPFMVMEEPLPASTDVGDVSWITPTAQFAAACFVMGTPEHSWQLVAQGKTRMAHNGMLYAAKVLALSAAELFEDKALLGQAREELQRRLKGKSYASPIPEDVLPGINK